MTDQERPLCDCPEPCGCYAEGYAAGCGCRPCRIKRAVLETTVLVSSSATLGDHDNRN